MVWDLNVSLTREVIHPGTADHILDAGACPVSEECGLPAEPEKEQHCDHSLPSLLLRVALHSAKGH